MTLLLACGAPSRPTAEPRIPPRAPAPSKSLAAPRHEPEVANVGAASGSGSYHLAVHERLVTAGNHRWGDGPATVAWVDGAVTVGFVRHDGDTIDGHRAMVARRESAGWVVEELATEHAASVLVLPTGHLLVGLHTEDDGTPLRLGPYDRAARAVERMTDAPDGLWPYLADGEAVIGRVGDRLIRWQSASPPQPIAVHANNISCFDDDNAIYRGPRGGMLSQSFGGNAEPAYETSGSSYWCAASRGALLFTRRPPDGPHEWRLRRAKGGDELVARSEAPNCDADGCRGDFVAYRGVGLVSGTDGPTPLLEETRTAATATRSCSRRAACPGCDHLPACLERRGAIVPQPLPNERRYFLRVGDARIPLTEPIARRAPFATLVDPAGRIHVVAYLEARQAELTLRYLRLDPVPP